MLLLHQEVKQQAFIFRIIMISNRFLLDVHTDIDTELVRALDFYNKFLLNYESTKKKNTLFKG